ncbi:uncharacterized protein LOC133029203 [Cannabis sativa]|uniref:uncharacterized protein LOC133029203 n=1 Tax=Cannabis sativa TaxID=3483 RepID=UPI0029CA3E80|nr:uncharacterized protein LOC133029203 [Cannabis sativa]
METEDVVLPNDEESCFRSHRYEAAVSEASTDKDKEAEREKQQKDLDSWVENDFLCKNFILNGLSDDLYDYYNSDKSANEIWDALQKKYDAKKPELKITPSRKDFKSTLGHKTKEFSLESLITHLRIEEEARKQDRKDEVLVVSNNNTKKSTPAVLKPNGKNFKNQNRNSNSNSNRNNPPRNNNQSWNHNRNQHGRQPPPHKQNDPVQFLCYNRNKRVIWHESVGTSLASLRVPT